MDFVYRLPAYPTPAGPLSKLRIHTHERSPGGQTATALSACAALGLRTAYVGTISNDSNGALVRDTLVRRRIDVSRARARAGANPYAVILVADEERHQENDDPADAGQPTGERIVLWDRPPDMLLAPDDVPADL